MQNLAPSLRSLLKRPLFAGTVILTLALATGLVSAIIGLLHEVFVRPLSTARPDRLAVIYSTYPERGWDRASASVPELRDLAARGTLFESVQVFAAFRNMNYGDADGAVVVETNFSDADYLRLQGAQPLLGRLFTSEECRQGADALVVILHHRFWQSKLGGRPDILGTTIRLNDRPFTVIGVLAADYADLGERWQATDVFVPLAQAPAVYGQQVFTTRGGREVYGLAHLKPGVTLAQAQQDADRVALELAKEFPTDHAGRGLRLMSPREFLFREARPLAAALGVCAIIVLLIACANLAHLFLVQAAGRRRDVAVRAALGADRARLLRQSLGEVALLTAAGGTLGLLLGRSLASVFNVPGMVPMAHFVTVRIDPLVVLATLLLLAGCALVFGLWPAWRATRVDLRAVLQGGDRTSGDRAAARRRLALISLEVALATLLLVGTGLTARSLWWLSHRDTGYDRSDLVTGTLDLPRTRYPDRPSLQRFVRQLHQELQTIPGIDGASLWGPRVLGRATYNLLTTPEGLDPSDPKNHFMTRRLHMTPDALQLLRVPLLRGRVPVDNPAPGTPWEVVISQKYADRFFPGQDPIGRRIAISNSSPVEYLVVVGVAAPVHHYPRAESEDNVLGDIYLSMWNVPAANLSFIVRSSGDPGAVIRAVRERIARLDPTLAVVDAKTQEARLAHQERPQRFAAGVFAVYGVLATFLAVLGVYGVLAFSISQRTREFGVRLAVGASPGQILSRLLAQGFRWIGLGLVAGLVAAWLAGSLVTNLVVGITTRDPLVFFAVPLVILLVGLAAWLVPALRAARTDPLIALRAE